MHRVARRAGLPYPIGPRVVWFESEPADGSRSRISAHRVRGPPVAGPRVVRRIPSESSRLTGRCWMETAESLCGRATSRAPSRRTLLPLRHTRPRAHPSSGLRSPAGSGQCSSSSISENDPRGEVGHPKALGPQPAVACALARPDLAGEYREIRCAAPPHSPGARHTSGGPNSAVDASDRGVARVAQPSAAGWVNPGEGSRKEGTGGFPPERRGPQFRPGRGSPGTVRCGRNRSRSWCCCRYPGPKAGRHTRLDVPRADRTSGRPGPVDAPDREGFASRGGRKG